MARKERSISNKLANRNSETVFTVILDQIDSINNQLAEITLVVATLRAAVVELQK